MKKKLFRERQEVSEEVVQEAKEQNKEVNEIVDEIIEEEKPIRRGRRKSVK